MHSNADTSQVIALPAGGGALRGIGETFEPDLFTGTGNFTVPLTLPAGRNNFQPNLKLTYSTGNGNGSFGLGWKLSIPAISRKTDKGLPRYDDSRDTFVLSGFEDLVAIGGNAQEGFRYRPRTEGLFADIRHFRNAGNDYWHVRSKDGLISVYGTPRPANAPADWRDPAVLADPNDPRRIFAWHLSLTLDSFGNRIEYHYLSDTTAPQGTRRWQQLYLAELRYLDYGPLDAPQFLVTVSFDYTPRPDPFSDYRAGFEVRTTQRCRQIRVTTHADAPRLLRSYQLSYLDERSSDPTRLPRNRVSLLSQLSVIGHDGDAKEQLPALDFGYTAFEPERRRYQPFAADAQAVPDRALDGAAYELVDLFGNGLPDVLQMDGVVRFWRNLGNGRFDQPRMMREAPATAPLASTGVQIADMDGDGRADLLVTDERQSGYYPLSMRGEWDRRSFVRYRQAPSVNLEDPAVRLIDLDGDGVIDALRLDQQLELYYNDGANGWRAAEIHLRRNGSRFPAVSFSDPRVKLADINGDGLQDIVLIHNGRIDYWPYLGYGRWGERITMQQSPRFADAAIYGPDGYDPRRLLIGDIDGDGCADLVYVESGQISVWLNQSGNGWSAPIRIQGTPPVSDQTAVRLADMHGTGTLGILWTYDFATRRDSTYKFLDLTGGVKPYLLNQMDNNLGAITQVTYASSTSFYLADAQHPTTRWQTTLPFPVQVVARVDVIDALSGSRRTSEYHYHHGYWDGVEREFRGFARVDQRDSETFAAFSQAQANADATALDAATRHFSPPTETRSWFHPGPVGSEFDWHELNLRHEFWSGDAPLVSRPAAMSAWLATLAPRDRRDAIRALRGRLLRSEVYALDGSAAAARPYTVTEQLHELLPVDTESAPSAGIYFAFNRASRTTQWERGDDPLTQVTFSDDYDAFGQPRQQTAVALPRRLRKRQAQTGALVGRINVNEELILATHTRSEYALPVAPVYIYDRVAQSRTFELVAPPALLERDPDDVAQLLRDQVDAAWAVHRQFRALLDPWQPDQALPAAVRLIDHTLNYYDGAAVTDDTATGRALGELGPFGVLVRSESLVASAAELAAALGERLPSYLGGNATLPANAPALSLADLGYRLANVSADQPGYYVTTQHLRYDFHYPPQPQQRGMLLATRDPFGNQTTQDLDAYWFLPVAVRDPLGLTTQAVYDYRLFQPHTLIAPDGTSTHVSYTPLGLVAKQFAQGNNGEGGSTQQPEVEWHYDLLAFQRSRHQATPQPAFVHTRRRVWYASAGLSDEVIEQRDFSDGFGRLLQTRAQAETLRFGPDGAAVGLGLEPGQVIGPAVAQRSADQVIVSGWQVYDNKGRVVEKYEPFFAQGWEYQPEAEARQGMHSSQYYDPRGQLIRTVKPDGSEQRVLFGIPHDLRNPADFAPTPWESYSYDANDLAPLSYHPQERLPDGTPRPLSDRAPAAHHFTPTSTVIDALGRGICQVVRNGPDPEQNWFITRSRYDMRGNLLAIIDASGRVAQQQVFDLLDRVIRVESSDAGLRTSIFNAVDQLVEYRDSRGSLVLRLYDVLQRPTQIWACDAADQPFTLRERLRYGDGGSAMQPAAERAAMRTIYALGRLVQHDDEAGRQEITRYDFQGRPLEQRRLVISDAALAAGWSADWSAPNAEAALDPQPYQTSHSYDALGRPVLLRLPADVEGQRATLTPSYNRAGALEKVELDGQPYVSQIAYNAKGQRVLIAYGNGVMTRYAYDPTSFRLIRLRSERFIREGDSWRGSGAPLQELHYSYDLAGNISAIDERVPGCGIANSPDGRDRLLRRFSYDALYRLLSADGRACIDLSATQRIDDTAVCGYYGSPPLANQDNAPDLTERYTESYRYDPLGNLLELIYQASSRVVRNFQLEAGSNRLQRVSIGATPLQQLSYDANGNLRQQNSERHYSWDYADRLRRYRNQPDGSEHASVEVQYLYAADGTRVKKWVRKQGSSESRVFIAGLFEHYRSSTPSTELQNNLIHVMDEQQRIALVRRGPPDPEDAGPAVQYHLSDHLGSSSVVLDTSGAWINREEYSPYGETLFGSFARKRYRFTGKERDSETGLYYHGARYYAPWLARWISCDPLGMVDGINLYAYVRGNPLRYSDPNGTNSMEKVQSQPTQQGETAQGVDPAQFQYQPPSIQDMLKQEIDYYRYGTLTAADRGPQLRAAGPIDETVAGEARFQEMLKVAKDNPGMTLESILFEQSAMPVNAQWKFLSDVAVTGGKGAKSQTNTRRPTRRAPGRAPSPGGGRLDWQGRRHAMNTPTVQAGHRVSKHSGAPERLAIEDADFNQLSNWVGETQRITFEKPTIMLQGVIVDKASAMRWAGPEMSKVTGLTPKMIESAPAHPGWSPPPGFRGDIKRQFMQEMFQVLSANPKHPLRFLIDSGALKRSSR